MLLLQVRELCGDVGQDKEVRVLGLPCEPFRTLIGEVCGVQLLVDDEVQRLHGLRHLTVVVGHIELLGLKHSALYAVLGEIFDKRLVLWQCLVGTVECQETLFEELSALLGVGIHRLRTF